MKYPQSFSEKESVWNISTFLNETGKDGRRSERISSVKHFFTFSEDFKRVFTLVISLKSAIFCQGTSVLKIANLLASFISGISSPLTKKVISFSI